MAQPQAALFFSGAQASESFQKPGEQHKIGGMVRNRLRATTFPNSLLVSGLNQREKVAFLPALFFCELNQLTSLSSQLSIVHYDHM